MNVLATVADLCISLLTQDTVTMGFPEEKTLKWRLACKKFISTYGGERKGRAGTIVLRCHNKGLSQSNGEL